MTRNIGRPRKNIVAEPTPPASRASSSSSQSSNGNQRASLAISKSNPVAVTPVVQHNSWAAVVQSGVSGSLATPVAVGASQVTPKPIIPVVMNGMPPAVVVDPQPIAPAAMNRGITTAPVLASPSVRIFSSKKPIKIDFDDIVDEVHFWESAFVYFVLGSNPPLRVMEGYVRRI
ncbi:unnamed protein product [Amaranthus hypochondriacus]